MLYLYDKEMFLSRAKYCHLEYVFNKRNQWSNWRAYTAQIALSLNMSFNGNIVEKLKDLHTHKLPYLCGYKTVNRKIVNKSLAYFPFVKYCL